MASLMGLLMPISNGELAKLLGFMKGIVVKQEGDLWEL